LNATTDPGWVSAWNHFVLFGILEGRSPNGTTGFTGLFDNAKYLAQNADVNTAVSGGAFRNGFEHYLLFGAKEGRAAFDKAGNAIDLQSLVTPGKTFTLTTGVDNIVGTSGNDTIIADNTGLTQLSAADTINGGAGTDTLKIYQPPGFALANTVFGQLTSVENIYINNGTLTNSATLNVSGLTGVTSIALDSPLMMGNNDTFTLQTAAGQAVSLTNVLSAGNSTFNLNGASDVTLNGVGPGMTLDFTSSGTTALKLTTTGAASTITLTNTGSALATLTVAGNKALDVTTTVSTLKTVTSTATGDVTFNNAGGAVENYSGGAGRDILTLVGANVKNVSTGAGNDRVTIVTSSLMAAPTIDLGDGDDILILHAGSLTNLTSGAQLKGGTGIDRLVTKESTILSAAQIARINEASGFEVLGFAGNAISGVDVSQLTSINKFYVEGNTGVTISNANSNTQTTINLDVNNTQTITIANAPFENSTTVVIDNQGGGSKTLTGLTVTGITNVALSSTGKSGSSNTITTLTNSDNTVVTITGDRDLTIGSLVGNASVGSKVDASAFTMKLTVTGSTKNDILIGGAGADSINGGDGNDTIIGGAGNDTITGGNGADKMTGGAGADTFVYLNPGEGGAARSGFNDADGDNKISNGDKLTFGGAIDIITDFQSGIDKLDAPGSATLVVADIGTTSESFNLAANTVFTIRGNWDGATYVFTVSSTGSDTIALYVTTAGNFDTAQNIGNYVVLQGVTSVVAADFV